MSQAKQNRKRPVIPAKPRKKPQETLHQWGERMKQSGRDPALIMLAQLIMSAQRNVYRGFKEILAGELQKHSPPLSTEIRREFYLNRSALWDGLLKIFTKLTATFVADLPRGLPPDVEQFWNLWIKATPQSRSQVIQVLMQVMSDPKVIAVCSELSDSLWDSLHSAHLELLKNVTSDGIADDLFADPAFRFLVFYDFPCMLYFSQTSQEMFSEAASGKLTSVTNLLLIDKELEFIEEIQTHTSQWRNHRDPIKLPALLEATGKPLPGKFAPRWLMYRATHLLIDLSDALAEACFSKDSIRFTHTDLHQLLEITCPFQAGDDACAPETLEQFRDGLKDNKEKMTSVTVWGK